MNSTPNFILVTTDQQRFDTISAAGHRHVWTPHLDWLCDSGVRFPNAFTDCPVCLPARSTIMTGRHAWNHRVMSNRFVPGAVTAENSLAGLLTRAGWQTRLIGKAHHAAHVRHHVGFEHLVLNEDHEQFLAAQPGIGSGRLHGLGGNENAPAINPIPQALAEPAWLVDRSLDFLETRDPARPYLLWLSFNYPHPPYTPSREHWDLYRDRPVPPRITGDWSKDFTRVPPAYGAVTQELSMTQRLDDRQLADLRRAYYACISEVDYQLGRLFGALQETDALRQTWVLFTSDHGEMLGDHSLGGKCVPFEPVSRVPFIVRPPAAMRDAAAAWRGTTSDAIVCLADILPTFLGAAGVVAPANIDGLDLRGVWNGQRPQRDRFFHSCMYLHAVRQGRWKLCRETLANTELLFDLVRDPAEQHNLANDRAAAKTRRTLSRLLDEHLAAHDLSQAAAADSAVATDVRHLPRNTYPGLRSGRRQP
jgi:arylsulfatase A-like enzyme